MRTVVTCSVIAGVLLAGFLAPGRLLQTEAAETAEPMLVHNVYFSLKDNSAEARAKMVAACKKYLSKHPGEVFFTAGTLAEERKLRSNDRDFDVGLVIVLKRKADLDEFDKSARHRQFVEENKANWKKVRVFDVLAEP